MTIPASTQRAHYGTGMDQWQGDCPRAIRRTSQLPLGPDHIRAIDMNFQVCAVSPGKKEGDDVPCLHSNTARLNGWYYITFVNRYGVRRRRKMTPEELDRHIRDWLPADILRWRRTPRLGTSYESRIRVFFFHQLIGIAKSRGVVICPELKSRLFADIPQIAVTMHEQVVATNVTVYPMTLVTMIGWRGKMRNFHNAGFETALLLYGHPPKPADLPLWRPFISAIW